MIFPEIGVTHVAMDYCDGHPDSALLRDVPDWHQPHLAGLRGDAGRRGRYHIRTSHESL